MSCSYPLNGKYRLEALLAHTLEVVPVSGDFGGQREPIVPECGLHLEDRSLQQVRWPG